MDREAASGSVLGPCRVIGNDIDLEIGAIRGVGRNDVVLIRDTTRLTETGVTRGITRVPETVVIRVIMMSAVRVEGLGDARAAFRAFGVEMLLGVILVIDLVDALVVKDDLRALILVIKLEHQVPYFLVHL